MEISESCMERVKCVSEPVYCLIPPQDFVKKDLLANDIIVEEFGGDIQCVNISALKVNKQD